MSASEKPYISDVWKDGIFKQKTVFCTGGSGDLCSVQVQALVYLGADACIVGRNSDKARKAAARISTARQGAKVIGFGGVDVRDLDSLQKAAAECVKQLGGIDFVIAGAAGNFLAPLSKLSSRAFKTVMEIDVLGSYNTVKAVLPYLLESVSRKGPGESGRIVFISATYQYRGIPMQTHGVVAKSGVDALAVNVALEMGPRGIQSNVIAPGPIANTEGVDRLVNNEDSASLAASIPSGRLGCVKDVADAAVYLFSHAGSYVNGATLVVDGGAWRVQAGEPGAGLKYPDYLLAADGAENNQSHSKAKM